MWLIDGTMMEWTVNCGMRNAANYLRTNLFLSSVIHGFLVNDTDRFPCMVQSLERFTHCFPIPSPTNIVLYRLTKTTDRETQREGDERNISLF